MDVCFHHHGYPYVDGEQIENAVLGEIRGRWMVKEKSDDRLHDDYSQVGQPTS